MNSSREFDFQTQNLPGHQMAHICFLLWSVVTARIRVGRPLSLWDTASSSSMHPHLHTHVKPNKALHHIRDSLFAPTWPLLVPLSPTIWQPEWKSMAEVRLQR
ncbi:hypothetical protein CEXT_581671 [Caerostris extrusa]|uniref:Uncharacterized protein n=1 Tax=Caerostris extrusa TaxID=172846 RepID=A0AAV4XJ44_CAEEX|nr:hypothetical protein CEXT_581671 [Caerostris extrusa]